MPTANLTTTSRYLNINRRELHRAMRQFEESPQSIADLAQSLHNRSGSAPVVVQQPNDGPDQVFSFLAVEGGAEGGIRTPTMFPQPAPQASAYIFKYLYNK